MSGRHTAVAVEARPALDERNSFAIWTVKSSFLRYIARLPDGVCSVSEDVRRIGGAEFVLPGRLGGSDPLVWRSSVSLRFEGHGGLLAIELRDLRLELGPVSGALYVAGEGQRPPVCLARASVLERSESTLLVELILTIDGASIFGDNYRVGEPLDPIHLVAEPLP